MFTNVAVVAKPGPSLQAIRHHLRNPVKYLVREFLSIDDCNQGLANYPFDILVMRVDAFNVGHAQMLSRARARFPKAGLISVSPEVEPMARYQVKEVVGHKLLQEPIEIDDLPSVIEKLMTSAPGPMRLHPRVRREDQCELVSEDGHRQPAQFIDFGQMGARLQVSPRKMLKRNMRFQLHYRSSSEPGRVHRIESNIVWAEMNSGLGTIVHGPQQMVGLRFIAAL